MTTKTGMSGNTKLVLIVVGALLLLFAGLFVSNFARGLGQGAPCQQETGSLGDFNCIAQSGVINIGDNTIISDSPGSGNSTIFLDLRRKIGSMLIEEGPVGTGTEYASVPVTSEELTGNPIVDAFNKRKWTYTFLAISFFVILFAGITWWAWYGPVHIDEDDDNLDRLREKGKRF